MRADRLVLVSGPESAAYREAIARAAPGWEIDFAATEEEFQRLLGLAEVVFDVQHRRGRPFASSASLRWLHTASTGVDRYLTPEFVASDVLLTNSRGIHAVPIAEHVMALMLAHARLLEQSWKDQRERRWGDRRLYERLGELRGKTLGLLGVGHIGSELAVRARAFGMRVIGCRRRPLPPPPGVERVYAADRLAEFLGQCDFLAVAVPLTAQTRGLLGRAEFAALKPGAYLVNVARGGVVDEDALVESLRAGRLSGAALDVFAEEPLPCTSVLYATPGVTITPHVAGLGPSLDAERIGLFADNLARYVEGRPLRNVVDKRAGY
ncbi:MAG: D-2-hydroxyacid dehydrogenase [Acetobacteraceae bacterium]|nr:D-2-hydroxyacid dehydrogenase [Acetobacteraceae bacterium]